MEIRTDLSVHTAFLKGFQDYIKAGDLGTEDQKESHNVYLGFQEVS